MRLNTKLFGQKQAATSTPCGLAFDPNNREVVIAEHAADGGFDIYRVPIDERRSVNITSTDLRTTLLAGNAHTDATQLGVSPDAPDEEILQALAAATESDPHAYAFTRTPDKRLLVTQVEQPAVTEVVHLADRWLNEQQPPH